jgi:hypothetical protein
MDRQRLEQDRQRAGLGALCLRLATRTPCLCSAGATALRTEVLEWSGSAWIRVWRGSLFQSPSQRSGFDVVYDAGRGRVLYLQGVDGSQSVVRLTWEWDGTSWQSGELFDEVIQGYRAVWDAKRSEVLVTGGERYAIRNGKHVVLRATGPWPVRDAASFFDGSRGELVVFGGCTVASPSRPLKKSREAQSCGFGVPLASRTAGESADSSRIRDVDGASKTLL